MNFRLLAVTLVALSPACARRALPGMYGDPPPDPAAASDAGLTDARMPVIEEPDAAEPDAAVSHDAAPLPGPDDAAMPVQEDAAQADAAEPEPVTRSDAMGGTEGGEFDDTGALPPAAEVKSILLRTGDRLDRIELTLRNGTVLAHGGTGGSEHRLELAQGEALTYARLCTGEHDGSTRVFFARLGTNQGHEVEGGNETSTCMNFTAPEGRQIIGFHGRSGGEVDALGFLYAPLPAP